MKKQFFLLVACLIIFNEVNCFHHRHHRKRSKKLMKRIPISEPPLSNAGDRETLKEALQLLNVGKKTLGLNTEDPDLLLQLVENPNEKNKSKSIEKLLEDPKQIPHAPIGKQFLALSGDNGKIKVDNFTNVTPSPSEKSIVPKNDSDIQDIFKMIMEKKSPDPQAKVFHKITIIETNQLKPYSSKELSHSSKTFKRRRRHKGRHLTRKFHIRPNIRQKRSKFSPTFDFFHRIRSTNLNETPFTRKKIPKKRNITNWRDNDNPRIEISLGKFPNHAYSNKKNYVDKTFKEPDDNFLDKEFLPSENAHFKKKENIKVGREKPNTLDNSLRFSDENIEKLIDAIGFGNSLKTVIPKITPQTEGKVIRDQQSHKLSTETTTMKVKVNEDMHTKIQDTFPPLDVNRYALVERVIPLEKGGESILSHVSEVIAIMSITLLCFVVILMVHSKIYRATSTQSHETTEKKIEQGTPNIRQLNKNYPYSGMYCYKTVMDENDQGLCSLEWQSESGDWLSDIEGKEKL